MHLITTFLLVLSLAGAAQAQPAAPVNSPNAPAASATKTTAQAPRRQPADPRAPVPGANTLLMLALGLTALGLASGRRESPKKFSSQH